MHINLINKKLIFDDYKVKCSIGKRGISHKKREGDLLTPRGTFKLIYVLYRKDRVKTVNTSLKKIVIKRNMGWCDDSKSKYYNKIVRFPFKGSAEKLFIKKNIYDIIVVIGYNLKPVIKGKGSAKFIHVATKNYKSTKGCVAICKINLKKMIKLLNKKSVINIS